MITDVTVDDLLHDLLAGGITERMAGTSEGHCARFDYLSRVEAEGICRSLRGNGAEFAAYVLGDGPLQEAGDMPLYCGVDEAIERRNRKQGRLCLFVPADLVDAMVSSLGNSFALIDGRDLYAEAERHILGRLVPATREMLGRVVSSGG